MNFSYLISFITLSLIEITPYVYTQGIYATYPSGLSLPPGYPRPLNQGQGILAYFQPASNHKSNDYGYTDFLYNPSAMSSSTSPAISGNGLYGAPTYTRNNNKNSLYGGYNTYDPTDVDIYGEEPYNEVGTGFFATLFSFIASIIKGILAIPAAILGL